MRKIFTFIILIGLLIVSCGSSEKPESKTVSAEPTNKQQPARPANAVKAPDFTLATIQGDIVKMSDLSGKVVLVNFWGSW